MNALRMKPNLYLAIAVSALVFSLAYYFINNTGQLTTATQPTTASEESPPTATRAATITKPILTTDGDGITYTGVTETYNQDAKYQNEKYAEFQIERGYPDQDDYSEYSGYDLATLEKLANSGDVRAMLQLAKTLEADVNIDREKIRPLYIEAAIRGSTFAMDKIAMEFDGRNFDYAAGKALSTEVKKSLRMEAMAWCLAAALRGDLRPKMLTISTIEQGIAFHKEFELTADDRQAIDKRSKDIYAELEAARLKRGLGAFDNFVPPEVKQRYENLGWK